MNKDQALQYITNAMSLRAPQQKSLALFVDYLESGAGKKVLARVKRENRGNLGDVETATKDYARTIPEAKQFQAFERTFPAYTFALATGVGKTRLMGAFTAYLHLVYGIRHFMLVAPGNTIYRKLVDDFSKANNPKYVFRGIGEININTTRIITKDNYEQNQATASLFGNQIQINIFNVQQFAQKDIEQEKGITKFSETLGESYFEYLNSLSDLVVLLDESHHYHADAALGSLDRINPLMGLEFTATPYISTTTARRNAEPTLKKNIFYTYNLGDAIRDGYVKDPWVGTEADVDFSQFDQDSIDTDARKLQLAAYFHERAKVALKEYALENNKTEVKPVMLVVAKDTAHASQLRTLIDSDDFRGGAYKGKVIEVHTKTKGEEADETIEKLLSLEHPDNIVEIVIHVNMLKEGWDVTNIYTIAPIRSSASEILTEQTIGRGLRLPYGERTGNKNVDRVMIVAHDNYAKVVEGARKSALIQPTNVESVSIEDAKIVKEVVEVPSAFVAGIQQRIKSNPEIMKDIEAQAVKKVAPLIAEDTPEDVKLETIKTKTDEYVEILAKQEASRMSFLDYHRHRKDEKRAMEPFGEGALFGAMSELARKGLEEVRRVSGQTMELRNIPVPRLMLTPHYGELIIENFDLDTKRLSRYATEASILEERLQGSEEKDLFGNIQEGARETELTKVSSFGEGRKQSPENTIIAALAGYPLVDYESGQKELLLKLAKQAVTYYRSFVGDDKTVKMMVENNFRQIAREIYDQILERRKYVSDGYLESEVREPKSTLEGYRFQEISDEQRVTLGSQVDRFPREKVYTGFKKACHSAYRFDSSDEGRLAYLLDKDPIVEDWLRPAPNQFEGLFWRDRTGDSLHRYEPDFVVEFENEIVMVEVKPGEGIEMPDAQEKKKTAEKYCELVSKNIGNYGIVKPWRYVIVPTEKITLSATIGGLLASQGSLNKTETDKSDLFFSDVISDEKITPEQRKTHVWICSLQAIATSFTEQRTPEIIGWKPLGGIFKLNKDMFIAQVVGKSMEPTIKNDSWCLFRPDQGGSRNGKIVLVESRKITDPETRMSFTIKRYHSEKEHFPDGTWIHKKITLSPDNKDFDDIVLENVREDEFHVVAEFVTIL
ncbi:MAG: DEAD/DEAH box helicase family protein [Candidatus Omnitrophica bacterium]|nr:DEAD/DEAH box helicase family protein [Candidatus Omnitrophota bacterium]